MPLHNFKCPQCEILFEKFQSLKDLNEFENCPHCGSISRKTFERFCANSHGGLRLFKPRWFEHLTPEPIFIESRRQLKEECKKNNCYSQYIEDSFNR